MAPKMDVTLGSETEPTGIGEGYLNEEVSEFMLENQIRTIQDKIKEYRSDKERFQKQAERLRSNRNEFMALSAQTESIRREILDVQLKLQSINARIRAKDEAIKRKSSKTPSDETARVRVLLDKARATASDLVARNTELKVRKYILEHRLAVSDAELAARNEQMGQIRNEMKQIAKTLALMDQKVLKKRVEEAVEKNLQTLKSEYESRLQELNLRLESIFKTISGANNSEAVELQEQILEMYEADANPKLATIMRQIAILEKENERLRAMKK